MLGIIEGAMSTRRMSQRARAVADHVGDCPRRRTVLWRTLSDLEALRALTEAEREAADAHLARRMSGAGS